MILHIFEWSINLCSSLKISIQLWRIIILWHQLSHKFILTQMQSSIFVTSFIILIVFLFYKYWILPVKIMKNYAKTIKKMGYKVLEYPYNPLKHDIFQAIKKGVREGDAMKAFKQQRGQYDVIVTNSLFKPKLQFNHPDFIKDFYSVDKHYQYPKEQKVVKLVSRASGRNHFSLAEGAEWRRKRKIFNKNFNFDFLKSKTLKIAQICEKAIQQEERLGVKIQSEGVIQYNIVDLTTRIFYQIMMEIFLGGTNNQQIDGKPAGLYLAKVVEDSISQAMMPINYILGNAFLDSGITKEQRDLNSRLQAYRVWALKFVTKRVEQINKNFEQIKDKPIPSDLIEGLIVANRKALLQKSNEQTISSPEEIVDDFTSFFIAGIQTTAAFTQMMIHYIAIYPEVEQKIRKQIDLHMKDDDYSYENVKKLTYIDMLQKQTTRYFGPGTTIFPRKAAIDNYLNGLPIKQGTQVMIMHVGNHYSQKYFKDPKVFRPERWESQCNDLPPFVCGGFSAGARVCIGKHLALLDTKVAIIKFLKRYKKLIPLKQQIEIGFSFALHIEQMQMQMVVNEQKQKKSQRIP